jgi:small nuclear ribonucleoprotein (snRNP)-like protein
VERPDRRLDALPAAGLPGSVGGDLDVRLARWAAEARVDEAARVRSREQWLRRQAEEESAVAGVLADLLEAGRPVTVHTRSGRRHTGTIRALGDDFVALVLAGGRASVLVALTAVASLRTPPGDAGVVGDRDGAAGLGLADVVVGLAADREQVTVVTADGEAIAGTLQSVGRDVAVVRTAGEPPAMCYVPLAALGEIVVGG